MITVAAILSTVSSMIQDDSTGLQIKLLEWLNMNIQNIVKMRQWNFLKAQVAITLSSTGIGILPADFNRLIALKISRVFLPHNLIAASEFPAQVSCGYTLSPTEITIYPAEEGIATLDYMINVPFYTATDTTCFPIEMQNILYRLTLTNFYEYDMDERASASMGLAQLEMKQAKKWDNGLTPLPQRDPHSMLWRNV